MIKSFRIRNTNPEPYQSQLTDRLEYRVLLIDFDANTRRVSICCQDEKGSSG